MKHKSRYSTLSSRKRPATLQRCFAQLKKRPLLSNHNVRFREYLRLQKQYLQDSAVHLRNYCLQPKSQLSDRRRYCHQYLNQCFLLALQTLCQVKHPTQSLLFVPHEHARVSFREQELIPTRLSDQ